MVAHTVHMGSCALACKLATHTREKSAKHTDFFLIRQLFNVPPNSPPEEEIWERRVEQVGFQFA